MRKIICFLFLMINLNAATLMTYEVVENSGNIDLRLSFDSPFDGKIFQKKEENTLKIILNNTTSNEKFITQLRSNIISSFVIENVNDTVEINIKGVKGLKASAGTLEGGLILNINLKDESMSGVDLPTKDKEEKNSSSNKFQTLFLALFCLIIAAMIFVIFKKLKKQKEDFNLNFKDLEDFSTKDSAIEQEKQINKFEEPLPNEDEDEIFNQANNSKKEDEIKKLETTIIYQNQITNEKELVLIQKDGNIYLNFLSKDNKIPKEIYEKMIQDESKFNEFLEICKNQNRL